MLRFLSIVAMVLISFSSHATAKETMDVMASGTFAPYSYQDEHGVPAGFSIDVYNAVGKLIDVDFNFILENWGKAQERALSGETPLLSLMSINEERKKKYDFSRIVAHMKFSLVGRNGESFNKLNLDGVRIAATVGGFTLAHLKQNYPKAVIIEVDNQLVGFDLVKNNEADAMLTEERGAIFAFEQHNITELANNLTLLEIAAHIPVVKGHPELLEKINKALSTLHKDGTIQKIIKKWGARSTPDSIAEYLTQEEKEFLKKNTIITVAPDPAFLPLEGFDDLGNYVGMSADYIKLLEKYLGIKFEILQMNTWSEVVKKAKVREADILPLTTPTPERLKYLQFTDEYLKLSADIFVRKSVTGKHTIEAFHGEGFKIAVGNNYGVHEWLIKEHPELNLIPVETIEEGLKMVSTGLVDAFVGNTASVIYMIEKNGIVNLRIAGASGYFYEWGLASRNDWPVLNNILNKGLQLITEEEHRKIQHKWIGISSSNELTIEQILQIVAGVLVLIVGLSIFWAIRLKKVVASRTKELRETSNRYKALIENSPICIHEIDLGGSIVSMNKAGLAMMNADEDAVCGIDYLELPDVNNQANVRALFAKALEGEASEFEFNATVNDEVKRFASSFVPLQESDGKITRLMGMSQDITEKYNTTQTIKISEERLSSHLNDTPLAHITWDIKHLDDETVTFFPSAWNKSATAIFGYSAEEAIGKDVMTLIMPGDADIPFKDLMKAIVEGAGKYSINDNITKDGKLITVEWNNTLIYDKNNKLIAVSSLAQDKTEQLTQEKELAIKTEMLEAITHIQSLVDSKENPEEYFDEFLKVILKQTGAEYGFIGEILNNDEQRYLRTKAITDIAWNEETRKMYAAHAPNMEFYNLESLFGYTIRTGDNLLTNDPQNHKESTGLPGGHPAMNSYLGLPLNYENKLVGMVGIANKPGGFMEADINKLSPITAAAGQIIYASNASKELMATNIAIHEAKDIAEESARVKSEFLAHMSHELRTPLNSIIGFSQMLQTEIYGELNEKQMSYANMIDGSGNHLLTIINDILNITKADAGKLVLNLTENLNIFKVIMACNDIVKGKADDNKLKLIYNIDKEYTATIDDTRFKQIIINILSNAIKYSPEKGKITLDLIAESDSFLIKISDEGIGLSDKDKILAIKAFVQVGRGNTSRHEGTGLGLALCIKLAEMHSGKFWLEDNPAGSGLTACLEIPNNLQITVDNDE